MSALGLAAAELALLAALAVVAAGWALWPALLAILAVRRRPPAPPALPDEALPAVAVLVPTLDEAAWIDGRLDDLAGTDYPRDRLRVVVVDGGSRDDTAAHVRARAARDRAVRLLELPGAGSKSEQVGAGLAAVAEEIAVVTDADVRLPTDTIRRLVEALCADPRLGAAGAWIAPATPLPEERLHWALVNRLWRLEGEALGASLFSGACYALRTKAAEPPAPDAIADDAHLALGLVARGWRVRLLRTAPVVELRVPRAPRELVAYRRRRGAAYLRELRRAADPLATRRSRWLRAARRLQLEWAPRAALLALALAPPLLWASPRRAALGLLLLAALAPAALALGATALAELGPRRPRAALAAVVRLVGLDAWALATLAFRRDASRASETRR